MSHRTARSIPADGWTPSVAMGALLILVSLLAGCGGGSAGGIPNTSTPTPTPAEIFELEPRFGGGGTIITFRATSIDSNPDNLRVEFSDFSLTTVLDGKILDVRDDGTQTGLGTIWAVDVLVPGGVRSGSVTLYSGGLAFGGFAFDAAPEIVGALVGLDGTLGAVTETAVGFTNPSTIYIYGNNLVPSVTDVTVDDGTGVQSAAGITYGPPAGAGFSIPNGMEVIQVDLPNFGPLSCETVALRIQAESLVTMTALLRTAEIEVPLSLISPGDLATDAVSPGYFNGMTVPPGIRRGDIAVDYSFFMTPASARYNITAEYQDPLDPTGNTWLPCTPVAGTRVDGVLPGSRTQNAGGVFLGPGSREQFLWDSATDLPGGPFATRVRLSASNPTPNTGVICLAGEWVSPLVVIDNGAPSQGTVIETFDFTTFLDPAGGSAVWGSGILSPPASGGSSIPVWGLGFDDVVLLAGHVYEFDTDTSRLFDITDASNPVELIVGQPGVTFTEFHLRSLVVEDTALVFATGLSPLVIRCAGTTDVNNLACEIRGSIFANGADAIQGTNVDPGIGGAAGPGGTAGGNGARIEVSGLEITSLGNGAPGATGGGAPGQSTSMILPQPTTSTPRAGGGGGGGGALRGAEGVQPFDTALVTVANPGAGGGARGDAALTLPLGGSGGGGGGACAIRTSGSQMLVAKHGGGGGGGGGAIEIAVRGRLELHGSISADGGNGSRGSTGQQAGPGGGGGGGTIALRSTGTMELFDTAVVSVDGGAGATAGGLSIEGGDGAEGTVRFESNDQVIVPNPLPMGLTLNHASSGTFETAGRLSSRARSLPYPLYADDGVTTLAPLTFGMPTIFDAPGVSPTMTHAVPLFEGAPPSDDDPLQPGIFQGPVGDPSLLEGAEFLRVRWFLFGDPGALPVVDELEVPFSN